LRLFLAPALRLFIPRSHVIYPLVEVVNIEMVVKSSVTYSRPVNIHVVRIAVRKALALASIVQTIGVVQAVKLPANTFPTLGE
jgi:hypothetical protein